MSVCLVQEKGRIGNDVCIKKEFSSETELREAEMRFTLGAESGS